MFLVVTTSPAPNNSIALILYILVAVMSLVGVGGVAGWLKSRNVQAVRDDKLDRVIEVVLDPETGFDSHTRQLADITTKVSRNGGGSQSVGDIASRVETAVGEVKAQVRAVDKSLQRHIGQHDERDERIAARVTVLENHQKGQP